MGGYGFAYIERQLLTIIVGRAQSIKAFLNTNAGHLNNFKLNYAKPDRWEEGARRPEGMAAFITHSIVIGNALALRKVMSEAIRRSQREVVPFAGRSLALAAMAVGGGHEVASDSGGSSSASGGSTSSRFEVAEGVELLGKGGCGLADTNARTTRRELLVLGENIQVLTNIATNVGTFNIQVETVLREPHPVAYHHPSPSLSLSASPSSSPHLPSILYSPSLHPRSCRSGRFCPTHTVPRSLQRSGTTRPAPAECRACSLTTCT